MDPIISAQVLNIFTIVVYYCVRPFILIMGVATCSFSANVFFKMGLNDSVRVSFFVLCIYDLGYVLMSSVGAVCIILNNGFSEMVSQMTFNPFYVNNISYWCASIFYHSSLMTTGYISGVRCCCVAIPFKFRKIFSTERTVAALVFIFIISCSFQLPVVATQYISYAPDKKLNITTIIILPTGEHNAVVAANDIFNRNILSWLTMAVMSVSLIIMATKLKSAAKFRHLATAGQHSSFKHARKDISITPNIKDNGRTGLFCSCTKKRTEQLVLYTEHSISNVQIIDLEGDAKSEHMESGIRRPSPQIGKVTAFAQEGVKELQIIKSVTLITAMVIILALPFMVYSLVRRFIPQFNQGEAYSNLFTVVSSLSAVCAYLNSSLNVFIFYNFNTKFRLTANETFVCFRPYKTN